MAILSDVGSRRTGERTSLVRRQSALILTVLGVIVVCGTSVWASPAPIGAPWDVFVLLDGAYRISLGQVPGTDFGNPVGPMVYGLTSVGMKWQGQPSLASVAYGNLVFVAIASALTWYGTRDRLGAAWRTGATLFIAVMLVSVRPLGYSPFTTSYAMLYNRYGWALLSIAMVMVLVEPGRPAAGGLRRPRLDAFVLGLILGLALYTKVTFAVAVLLLVIYFCLGKDVLGRLACAVAGVVAVAVACFLAWGVNPASYLRDILVAGQVQNGDSRLAQLVHAVLWSAPALVTTLILATVLWVSTRGAQLTRGPVIRLAVSCAAVAAFAYVLTAGNANERGELPLLAVVPVLVVASGAWQAMWARQGPAGRRTRSAALVALALVVLATAGRTAVQDGVSVADAVAHRSLVHDPPASQQIHAAALSDFVIPANADWQTAYRTAKHVPPMLDDGIALLRSHISPGDRVFAMAFGNPFNVALGLTPTRGGLLWYDLGYDVDAQHFPEPAKALGDADWVVVPQMVPGEGCCQSTVTAMLQVYGGYLASDFTPVARSASWQLWKRTRPAEPEDAGSR